MHFISSNHRRTKFEKICGMIFYPIAYVAFIPALVITIELFVRAAFEEPMFPLFPLFRIP